MVVVVLMLMVEGAMRRKASKLEELK